MPTKFYLDPAVQAFVDQSMGFKPAAPGLAARRHAFLQACRHFTMARPAGLAQRDLCVNGMNMRLYAPALSPPRGGWPTLLYLHGGGWDLGNLDSHDWFAYRLSQRLDLAVVAVDYRLAPEHPYPAALDDTLSAWAALRDGVVHESLSNQRLAIGGDSAGGTLAAAACVALRQRGLSQPRLQALVYPVLSASDRFPSMRTHANAPMLTAAGLANSIEGYLPLAATRHQATAMPLEADDYRGLAPALIALAEFDPLYDQGVTYADVLRQAGVPVQLWVGAGLVHGSLRGNGIDEVERCYDHIAAGLADAFA